MTPAVYVQAGLALLFVLSLLGSIAVVMRRFGMMPRGPARTQLSAVQVVADVPLDMKHRLVTLRRDAVHHILLLGGTQPLVLETYTETAGQEARADAESAEVLPLPAQTTQE